MSGKPHSSTGELKGLEGLPVNISLLYLGNFIECLHDNFLPGLGGRLFLVGGALVHEVIFELFEILIAEFPLTVIFEHASVDQALLFPTDGLNHHFSLHFLFLKFLFSQLSKLSKHLGLSIVV